MKNTCAVTADTCWVTFTLPSWVTEKQYFYDQNRLGVYVQGHRVVDLFNDSFACCEAVHIATSERQSSWVKVIIPSPRFIKRIQRDIEYALSDIYYKVEDEEFSRWYRDLRKCARFSKSVTIDYNPKKYWDYYADGKLPLDVYHILAGAKRILRGDL